MISLGIINITSGGTPQQISTKDDNVKLIRFQPKPTNAGIVYIGQKGMVISSGVGVWAMIPKPANAVTGPFAEIIFTHADAPAVNHLSLIYVDGTSNDGVLVAYDR